MKKILTTASSLAVFLASVAAAAAPASAATFSLGNDATSRPQLDTFSNFTVIDTNHPAGTSGDLTSFSYWAGNRNPFRFIIVDGSNIVKFVSPQITPAKVGVNTFAPVLSIHVQTGWNVGMYFASTGAIPYDAAGAPASFTAGNSGLPAIGKTLTFAGSAGRTYSFVATGNISATTVSNGGFTGFTFDPAFVRLEQSIQQALRASMLDFFARVGVHINLPPM